MISPQPSFIEPEDLEPASREYLARALSALELFTEAPLRLRDHASAPGVEFFDLQEEFEVGPRGQRFIVAVDHASGVVLVPVGRRLGASA